MQFYIKTQVTKNRFIETREINNADYLTIVKYITNNDLQQISDCIDEWLIENLRNADDFKILTNIDKFLIMINIRSMCIGTTISMVPTENKKVNYDVFSIAENIQNLFDGEYAHTIQITNDVSVILSIPTQLYIRDLEDLTNGIIYKIINDGIEYTFKEWATHEQQQFIATVPAILFNEIVKYINDIRQKNNIDIISENLKLNITQIKLDVFSNVMLNVIIAFYKNDLLNLYKQSYDFYSKIKYTDFWKLSPVESIIYGNFFNEEHKEKEDTSKSSNPYFKQ